MQDWNDGYYPKEGIGEHLALFFDLNLINVINMGRGGTCAKTFYDGTWGSVKENLKQGDFAILQFGINDRTYSNATEYRLYMTKMVEETLAKGATPILINPVRRSNFTSADSVYESYHEYPIITRELSASLKVPLIDMDTLSRNFLLSVGQFYALHYINMVLEPGEYANYKNGNNDNLHLQANGAQTFARITTEQIRVHENESVRNLANYLTKMYQVHVRVSPEDADSVSSISTYYPAGSVVTLKTTPKNGSTFVGWFDCLGNRVSSNVQPTVVSPYILTFEMPARSTMFTAVYTNGEANIYNGSESALTEFPKGTPKELENYEIVEIDSSFQDSVTYDKEMKSIFDAYLPDSGLGYSEYNNPGFTGEGFWNFENKTESEASYTLDFPSAGSATMAIVYANGGTSVRKLNIFLDHDYYVDFPPTGSWSNWDTAYVNMDLISGTGNLKFISMTEEGGPNIDCFGFSVEGIKRVVKKDSSETNPLQKFAQRTEIFVSNQILHVNEEYLNIKIYDVKGTLVYSHLSGVNAKNFVLDFSKILNQGVYQLFVQTKKQIFKQKIIVVD